MEPGKKFGTFGGVFTPSILTILGVIMYLRLPWIVGHAGLYMTLGIILVAHLISVTTGLSVASIATDKKVRVGGNYYIISRSLGLPIGGTLGIALFVGLSFSVSLYIIGFVESLLPVFGLAVTPDSIRVYGTIAVVLVAGIILVSTSLAIRVQYLIMTAIGLSLLSILFGKTYFAPPSALEVSAGSTPDLKVLFGIFFPAVTGFTAGVQMSGDLKDPRRSIPIGTISSILVGFLVYVGLSVVIAYRVDAHSLREQTDILLDISRFPALLVAGIWGATLSSAMGSLLGAPRILQATSLDRVTPRVFAKGYGPSNEPRNALVLTFVIAEAGILIGELNIIAAIISTFFITTYGVINLSCAIESWASPDFRPSFRIPTWVSVIGAIACILVMVQLDLLSFLAASLVLGLLYAFLKRKELSLESGDSWEGVWSSIVRSGLHRISHSVTHERNWRPNIILFSGGSSARPHLIDLGKWIVHKRGILSNFDLIAQATSDVLFSKPEQDLTSPDETAVGIFSRRLSCRDVYEGMETIAQVYGFSGVEPNTVIMGWAHNSRNPLRFARLVRYLVHLDYNILMLDYDQRRGFGRKARIDIWWRGGSNSATLELTLLKFLQAADEWRQARARILVPLDQGAVASSVYSRMKKLLQDQRVEADVKVISSEIQNRPFAETVMAESADADLIMLEIPRITESNVSQYVATVNAIVSNLGSVLLVHASSFFDTLEVGLEEKAEAKAHELAPGQGEEERLPEVSIPEVSVDSMGSPNNLRSLLDNPGRLAEQALLTYYERYLLRVASTDRELMDALQVTVERMFADLEQGLACNDVREFRALLEHSQEACFKGIGHLFERFRHERIAAQKEHMQHGVEFLLSQLGQIVEAVPGQIKVYHDPEDAALSRSPSAHRRVSGFLRRLKLGWFGGPVRVVVPLRALMEQRLRTDVPGTAGAQQKGWSIESLRVLSDLQHWFGGLCGFLGTVWRQAGASLPERSVIEEQRKLLVGRLSEIRDESADQWKRYWRNLQRGHREMVQRLADDITRLDAARRTRRRRRAFRKAATAIERSVTGAPALWVRNRFAMAEFTLLVIEIESFQSRLRILLGKLVERLRSEYCDAVVANLDRLNVSLEALLDQIRTGGRREFQPELSLSNRSEAAGILSAFQDDLHAVIEKLPDSAEILDEESMESLESIRDRPGTTLTVHPRRVVHTVVERDLIEPIRNEIARLERESDESRRVAGDVVRLVTFMVSAQQISDESVAVRIPARLADVVEKGIDRLAAERRRVQELTESLDRSLERLAEVTAGFNPYLLARSGGDPKPYGSVPEGLRALALVRSGWNRAREALKNASVQIMYGRSEGILLARTVKEKAAARTSRMDRILRLVEGVSPSPRVLEAVPHYYSQLFLDKHPISGDFWVGRTREMEHASQAIDRYRSGFHGGLLICGEPDSGKTALSRMIGQRYFDSDSVYQVFPPGSGSIEPSCFKELLSKVVGSGGSYAKIFDEIPHGSLIVIHDLELWWERSPGGFAVVDEILQLIDRYSDRCFFTLNANSHAYRLMNSIQRIEDLFLGVIDCEPFGAEHLEQAVLLRHRSTGVRFELGGQPEENLAQFTLAKLFNRYFDYAAGNIGMTLRAWIGHIAEVDDGRLRMAMPRRPALDLLEELDEDWLVWIQQILLHKRVTRKRLARIFELDDATVLRRCNVFKRSGLVTESEGGVLELNGYVLPFLIQKLGQMGVL